MLWWEIRFCRQTANHAADALSRPAPPLMIVFTNSLPQPVQEVYLRDLCDAALYNLKFTNANRPSTAMQQNTSIIVVPPLRLLSIS